MNSTIKKLRNLYIMRSVTLASALVLSIFAVPSSIIYLTQNFPALNHCAVKYFALGLGAGLIFFLVYNLVMCFNNYRNNEKGGENAVIMSSKPDIRSIIEEEENSELYTIMLSILMFFILFSGFLVFAKLLFIVLSIFATAMKIVLTDQERILNILLRDEYIIQEYGVEQSSAIIEEIDSTGVFVAENYTKVEKDNGDFVREEDTPLTLSEIFKPKPRDY